MFHSGFGYLLVVPLTGDAALRLSRASVEIAPTKDHQCSKTCYALSWNVQTVPKLRVCATSAFVTTDQFQALRDQIGRLVEC
jgi:hypothetical protein